jgi:hypothetical protein
LMGTQRRHALHQYDRKLVGGLHCRATRLPFFFLNSSLKREKNITGDWCGVSTLRTCTYSSSMNALFLLPSFSLTQLALYLHLCWTLQVPRSPCNDLTCWWRRLRNFFNIIRWWRGILDPHWTQVIIFFLAERILSKKTLCPMRL